MVKLFSSLSSTYTCFVYDSQQHYTHVWMKLICVFFHKAYHTFLHLETHANTSILCFGAILKSTVINKNVALKLIFETWKRTPAYSIEELEQRRMLPCLTSARNMHIGENSKFLSFRTYLWMTMKALCILILRLQVNIDKQAICKIQNLQTMYIT